MNSIAANAIDWYLNKVNELHLLPVNLATLLRDISAKQIGGEGFVPRPLTAKNFTDTELDAIRTLSQKAKDGKHVSYQTYYKDLGIPQRIAGKRLNSYLSPLNVVRTTLGQFAVSGSGGDSKVKDTYDFNREGKWNIFDHGDGTFSLRNWNYDGGVVRLPKKEVEKLLGKSNDGAYGVVRQNAANFGHTDDDPDSEKIKADIPMSDIDKRLGQNAGKYDIKAPVSDEEFKWRSAGAGVALGAPVGALLGALSGGIRMLDKKARRRWVRTMLSNIIGGAAIGAATGGIGGGFLAGTALDKFNSNEMNDNVTSEKTGSYAPRPGINSRRKKSKFKESVIKALAYSIPMATLAGAGVYAATKLKSLRDRLLDPSQDLYSMRNERINFVDDIKLL